MKHSQSKSVFDYYGKPSFGKALPLSFQHILAMIMGAVTPPLIVAGVAGANGQETMMLVQLALLFSGISTFLQLYPVGRFGAGVPTIFGVGFAYVPSLIAVGSVYGIPGILGAQIAGGIAMIVVGLFIKQIRHLFPPVVAGTVVLVIGLSLYDIAIKYMAGSGNTSAEGFGSGMNWLVGLTTLAVVLLCSQFGKGYLRLAAIIVGILVGYVMSFAFGMVDFTSLHEAPWVIVPTPFAMGIEFHASAVISMVVICIVNSVQTIGDLSATTVGGMNRELKDKELSGGLLGNGLCTLIGSIFGALPTASFSQNVGIVAMTKVISRYVLGIAAVFLIIAGLLPKFGAVMTTIPYPVLGGATIIVFGMITMTGIQLLVKDELSSRNITIVALSVALAMGINAVPEAIAQLGDTARMLIGSPVIVAASVAFTLNMLLPRKSLQDEAREREEIERQMNQGSDTAKSDSDNAQLREANANN
ncbi:purine permease [Oceanimonas baumannii]|uniref:uracil-xanthine permease family protein n=1 Tax=Oceanimonas baumannii TaxID=129578 RepID=UPI001D18BDBC|nr:nucleobase:cation symporter-2 family protein [Oceanimonas baumannii]MCC4263757.1 purine permease [Oceanimonas baumannii]